MGPAQQIQQLAAVTSAPESFTLVVLILGALFTVLGGSYIFTWLVFMEMRKVTRDLWKAVSDIKDNGLKHIEERLRDLESKDD